MDATERIVKAALDEFTEFGVRRSSMDSVARRAGVARATVYRRFANKDELVAAVVADQARVFVDRLDEIWDGPGSVEDRLTDAWLLSLRLLADHPLLKKLLRLEPETILPLMTVDGSALLKLITALYGERLQREVDRGGLPAGVDVELGAEVMARIGISVVLNPDGVVPTKDPVAARQFVERYLLGPLLATS